MPYGRVGVLYTVNDTANLEKKSHYSNVSTLATLEDFGWLTNNVLEGRVAETLKA